MLDRRKFLKTGTALTAAGFLLGKNAFAWERTAMPPAGLQLFTLFGLIEKDVPAAIKKVAETGYKEIESAFSQKGGFYGYSAKDFNALLKDNGLSWKSHHVSGAPFKLPPGAKLPNGPDGKPITIPPMKNLRENLQEIVDTAAEAGLPYLVCAGTPYDSAEELKLSVETLNKTTAACKKAGLLFAYHNHDGEFKTFDGKVPYEVMLSDCDPDMKFELDICWATKAGKDPVELFRKHPGRFHLWHVKDIDRAMTGPQPVGTGIIDWKRIFDNAGTSGMKHYFVEHDMPKDAYGSIKTSIDNLKRILG